MNVRYLEERDPEVNCTPRPLPFPLLPSHSGSVHGTFLASRGACSCRGRLTTFQKQEQKDQLKLKQETSCALLIQI